MRKKFVNALLAAAMCLSMAGCGGKEPDEATSPTDATVEATAEPEAPEGFVDNTIEVEDYTEDELYLIDGDWILGVRDENVYLNGAGFQSRFAVNMLTTDGSGGLGIAGIRDKADFVQLGDMRYGIDDLVRSRTEGFQVLSMLAADFGVDRYEVDESGEVSLAECMGTGITGDALREAYSERADLDDYTVCVYYLHAQMSGMEETEYGKCKDILESEYGIDHSSTLDGTLAVMLYYDVNGYDMFYTVAIASPNYWTDSADYKANMLNGIRHDISKCYLSMSGIPIGFVNQVFLRCDTDAVSERTANDTEPESGDEADVTAEVPDEAPEGDGLTVEGDETE